MIRLPLRGKSLRTLIPGKNAGDGISQKDSHESHGPGSWCQVVPYVAFNVHLFPYRLAYLNHRTVEIAALIGSALFQDIYGDSLSHTVLTSFWSHIWSCFNTCSVRFGATPTALISL